MPKINQGIKRHNENYPKVYIKVRIKTEGRKKSNDDPGDFQKVPKDISIKKT